jgi:hypothetical protein
VLNHEKTKGAASASTLAQAAHYLLAISKLSAYTAAIITYQQQQKQESEIAS